MYIGIDLGTSGVKAILLNEQQQILASHTEKLAISRPHPLWSEQHPDDWWQATDTAIQKLAVQHPLSDVKAIGLTGQMHGAVLLDKQGNVLRPAILWNDGRSVEQCHTLEQRVPQSREITGNLMMPGFTAPKINWVQEHEPAIFAKISKVLLPKDYLRWRMSGDFASDMSDAAGTMWLNMAQRRWDTRMLEASGLDIDAMPALFEGNQITGTLLASLAQHWGMSDHVALVAGGGDNAAGAIGAGIWRQGQAMLSLGTSGVYFAVSDGFRANTQQAVHSFCHALPNTWHLMSVMLSAASCLDWATKITGLNSVPALLHAAEQCCTSAPVPLFLPYLSGERTPHNNPNASGVLWGLTHQHGAGEIARSVVEGVSFALADCMDVLHATGLPVDSISLIGGGTRSAFWRQLLADVSGQRLEYRQGGDVGPALGAARLAQLACSPQATFADLLPSFPLEAEYQPNRQQHEIYQQQRQRFRQLYQQLKAFA
jgi:xylulokinase